jgi:hypothetical protein
MKKSMLIKGLVLGGVAASGCALSPLFLSSCAKKGGDNGLNEIGGGYLYMVDGSCTGDTKIE